MPKIVAICVVKYSQTDANADPIILSAGYDVDSFGFFQRDSIRQMCRFFSKTIVKRENPGARTQVQENDYNIFIYKKMDGIAGTIIADKDYPARVALSLIQTVLGEYVTDVPGWRDITQQESVSYPKLAEYTKKPLQEIDRISKIQSDLDDTKQVMQKSIEGILSRGEKLEDLVSKSDDLTNQSKMFYRQAKKTNSCCVIM